jgi:hypothetical protein
MTATRRSWTALIATVVLAWTPAQVLAERAGVAGSPSVTQTPVGHPYGAMRTSGLVVPRDQRDPGRRAVRIALAPVRMTWQAVMAAPRAAIRVEARHDVSGRVKRLFCDDSGRLCVYPTALVETGVSWNVGARLSATDLFGTGAAIRGRIGHGLDGARVAAGHVTTGALLGERLELELAVKAEHYPSLGSWDLGNRDDALEHAYRLDEQRGEAAAIADLGGGATIRAAAAYRDRRFEDGELDDAMLPGFEPRDRNVYGELELVWDGRRSHAEPASIAAPSTGWRFAGWAGWQEGLDREPGFARWGGEIQRYVDLYRGDRVLALRAVAEGVTGARDEVPFTDLPRLGGATYLRGYPRDRFRDRNLGVASAEYRWPVEHGVLGYAFVDAGRVWDHADELADDGLDALRVGFGGGVQLHGAGFITRGQIASSIDGGVFALLSFEPPYDTRPRGVTR